MHADKDATVTIRLEDDHLAVVEKPASLVVHPTYQHPRGTLLDLVVATLYWSGDERPAIVTRLDRQTSGLVIVSKSSAAHAALQRTAIDKRYLAIVHGDTDEAGRIDCRLAFDPGDRRRMIVADDGRAAVTEYRRVASTIVNGETRTLLECRLVTGRRHQIRVHLAASGWPIVGDRTYGVKGDALSDRHALHASRVTFQHPESGELVDVRSPLPAVLGALCPLLEPLCP